MFSIQGAASTHCPRIRVGVRVSVRVRVRVRFRVRVRVMVRVKFLVSRVREKVWRPP